MGSILVRSAKNVKKEFSDLNNVQIKDLNNDRLRIIFPGNEILIDNVKSVSVKSCTEIELNGSFNGIQFSLNDCDSSTLIITAQLQAQVNGAVDHTILVGYKAYLTRNKWCGDNKKVSLILNEKLTTNPITGNFEYLIIKDIVIPANSNLTAKYLYLSGCTLEGRNSLLRSSEKVVVHDCSPNVTYLAWKGFAKRNSFDKEKLESFLLSSGELPEYLSQEVLNIFKKDKLSISDMLLAVENSLLASDVREYRLASKVCSARNYLYMKGKKRLNIFENFLFRLNYHSSKFQTSIGQPILWIIRLIAVMTGINCFLSDSNISGRESFEEGLLTSINMLTRPWMFKNSNLSETLMILIFFPINGMLLYSIKHAYNRLTNYKW